MIKNKVNLLTAAGLLTAATLQAAYPLLVDDAAIVAPGETELVVYYEGSLGSGEHLHGFPVEITHGVHPRFELGLSFGYQVLDDRDAGNRESGILDTELMMKTLLLEQGERLPFSLTVEGTVSLPTASESRGLGSGNLDLGVNFAATREWERTALDLNAGYLFAEHFRGRRSDEDEWFLGAALRYMATDAVETFVETVLELPVGSSSGTVTTLRIGVNWELREDLFLGGGVGPSFGTDSPDVVVTAGATWAF